MNPTILFFLIGFTSSIVGFAVGYFSGEKTSDLLDDAELAELLKRASDSPTVHRSRRADLLDGDR